MKMTWQLHWRTKEAEERLGLYTAPYTELPPFEATEEVAMKYCRDLEEACPLLTWNVIQCVPVCARCGYPSYRSQS